MPDQPGRLTRETRAPPPAAEQQRLRQQKQNIRPEQQPVQEQGRFES